MSQQLIAMMVESLYPQVMIHLGKIRNPMTDKIERHLEAARMLIDVLGELEEKTEGRLNEGEKRMLQKALTELRLNYLDEMNRPAPAAGEEGPPPAEPERAENAGEAAAAGSGPSGGEAGGEATGGGEAGAPGPG